MAALAENTERSAISDQRSASRGRMVGNAAVLMLGFIGIAFLILAYSQRVQVLSSEQSQAVGPAPIGIVHIVGDKTHLGNLRQMETRDLPFEIVNPTDQPYRIVGVVKNCSCANVALGNQELPPHSSKQFFVRYTTGLKRGPVSEMFAVNCSETTTGKTFSVPARFSAMIHPEVDFSPSSVNLSPARNQETLRFSSPNDDEIKVIRASVDEAFIATVISPDGKSVHVSYLHELNVAKASRVVMSVMTTNKIESSIRVQLTINQ